HSAVINKGMQVYDPLRDGTGLVGTQYIHASEIFNGSKSSHNNMLFTHFAGSMAKINAYNGRQQLGSQPHGDCQREKKCLQHRAMKIHVKGENQDHQYQRDLEQEVSEIADSRFEI